MKNRMLSISLVAVLALTVGVVGCAAPGGEPETLTEDAPGLVAAAADYSSSSTEHQSQPPDRQGALLDRACAIYEEQSGVAIDSVQLKDALDQAQNQIQEEALASHLQRLVNEGVITQGEADEYLTWWQSRPDIAPPLPGLSRHGPGMPPGAVAAAGNTSGDTEGPSQPADRYRLLLDKACAIYQDNTGVAIDVEQLQNALHEARSELREEALESWLQKLVEDGNITQGEADEYLAWWQSRPDIDLPLPGLGGLRP